MNRQLTLIALALYALAYAVLFGTWVAVVFLHTPGADALVNFIIGTLGALTGHILTLIDPSRPTTDPTPAAGAQGGFTRPAFLITLALLAGCAGLNVQWVGTASYNSAAATQATLTPGAPVQAASAPVVPASGVKP